MRALPIKGWHPVDPDLPGPLYSFMAKYSKPLVGLDIEPSGIAAVQVHVNGRLVVERAAVAR